MNIVVCLKQVPAADAQIRVTEDGRRIKEIDLSFEMNEADTYALEAGLKLKDAHGGQVLVVSAGSRTESVLREALAKGADRGILITDECLHDADSLTIARALAAAIRKEPHSLILTGLQSSDMGFGQTGVYLAEFLGLPHATLIVEIEARETSVAVKRELEGGWFQRLELPLPALLTIQSGSNRVRYATLMGIKKARSKSITLVTLAELGMAVPKRIPYRRLFVPTKSASVVMLSGNAPDVAQQLVEKLRTEARIL